MSWLTDPDEDWDQQQAPPRSRLKLVAAMLAGWLAVSLVVLVVLLRFVGHDSASRSGSRPVATAGQPPTAAAPSGSSTGSSRSGVPAGWQLRAADDQTNCAAHSYGQVQVFFARTPCTGVHRSLFTTSRGGRALVVATSTVTFPGAEQAGAYLRLVDSDGTGNIADLLREGSRYPGSPSKLPPAAFASRQDGARVLVAEAAFADGPVPGAAYTDSTLQALARQAVDTG